MSLQVVRLEDEQKTLAKAADHLNHLLHKYKTKQILFLLSGGSSLELLHEVHTENLGDNITISMLDERYSTDHEINNFSQMTHLSFYRLASLAGSQFIDTRVMYGVSQEVLAREFEGKLRKWKYSNYQGTTIAIQGVGVDGHTAGIMPFPDEPEKFDYLFEQENFWVRAYGAKEKNEYPYRITTTLPFLRNHTDHSIVYAVGEGKKEALKKVLAKDGELYITPARIIHEMKNVRLFTV